MEDKRETLINLMTALQESVAGEARAKSNQVRELHRQHIKEIRNEILMVALS